MLLKNKLKTWQENNLITQEQFEKIFDFEKNSRNSLFAKTVLMMAAFFIGLGICLIVASNWEAIPVIARFILDFALFVAILYGAFFAINRQKPHLKDLFLALSFLMTAATIGLTSQTFHLVGSFQSFALSLACLSVPYILLSTSFSLNTIWLIVFSLGACQGYLEIFFDYIFLHVGWLFWLCVVLLGISYIFNLLDRTIKRRILLPAAAARLAVLGAYIVLLSIVFGYALPSHYNSDFTYFAVVFVLLFLSARLIFAYYRQDLSSFKYNTFFLEAYIFMYFASLFDDLLTSGFGFVLSGLSILGLFYLFKKSSKFIKKWEIFK